MKKILPVILLHAISLFSNAQSTPILPVKLPELLPPTPDVAALIKVGMGSVNYSTGAVSASVPIYEIKMGTLTLPVTLDYSSQGTRVEEACTRVGAGWALNAGGVVSRSVIGRPDELAPRPAVPTDLTAVNTANYSYFKNSANDDPTATFDTQPDEFRFSFNGQSGKFVLDQDGNAIINAHSNLKINVINGSGDIDEIIITATDGTKYYFGADEAYESTITVTNMRFKQSIKTSFYLTKIELLNGDKIEFFYSPLNTRMNVGLAETMVIAANGEAGEPVCSAPGTQLSHTTNNQSVEYRTCKLGSITSSNGQSITFGYANRNDPGNEVMLKSINVSNAPHTLRFYELTHYVESVASANLNGRFYLTKLTSYDAQPLVDENNDIREKQDYIFEYEDMDYHFNIYGQDYWGFARGGGGSTLIPPIVENPNLGGANREPNSSFSKKGVLKKIIYPTGGIEEFAYEGNTLSVEEKVNSIVSFTIEGRGQAGNTFSDPGKLYYGLLEPLRNQVIKVKISAIFDPAGPGPTPPETNTKTMFLTVTDVTTGAIRMNDYILGTQTLDQTLSVVAGHEYSFKMEVRGGDYMLGRTTITYDSSSMDHYQWVEKEAGGIRVKKILKTDPVTGKTVKKCYTYRSLDDPLKSSGVGSLRVSYHSLTSRAHYQTIGMGEIRYLCYSSIYSANSVFNLFRYDNSHISYKAIIESEDELMTNGGTEYLFYTPVVTGGGWAVWGPQIPNMPLNTSPNFNGLVHIKRVFDSNKRILSVDTSEYEIVSSGAAMITGVACRENFVPRPLGSPITSRDFDHFSVTAYTYSPQWRRLKSVTTKTTDNNNIELTKTEEYVYGSSVNVEVKSVRTLDSRGLEVIQEKKYSTDLAGQPIHDLMISKNIIAPVIEETISKNQQELARKYVLYKDWLGNGRIIQPEFIQLKESPEAPLANKIHFVSYDASGNITEVEQVGDMRTVYLWDYKRSAVIAEIKNASIDKVAYTSFETEATGNWTLSNAVYYNEGITGRRSFSGTLTRTFTQPVNLVVTLWSKSAAPTVNGSSTAALLTRGAWKLFRWKLTNVTSATVVGSNLDEVRLIPDNALMVTYTHKPFVGIESKCDPNNDITYFEYDFFYRLKMIKDHDGNVLKLYDYQYQAAYHSNPVWNPTGVTRCKPCAQSSNYITNVFQREEKDTNPQSATYNQLRWRDDGSGSCVITPDWKNTGTPICLTDANGYRTGIQRTQQKDMNPCSPTYNQVRNVDATNTIACPLNAPDWQNTGATRCKPCPGNSIYITNILQQGQTDNNPNSSTYGTTRWVDIGTSNDCVPEPGWENTSTPLRCRKNGSNDNTGEQEQEQIALNPCGGAYDQLRWIVVGTNTSACPLPCNTTTCSGSSRKCINGVCTDGFKGYISSVWKKVSINNEWVWKWECKYKYCFPDGTTGTTTYTEYHDSSCGTAGCLAH